MAKKLNFFFDQGADILYLSLGKPKAALSKEAGDDILIRLDPRSKKVVGCTILNLTKRFGKMKHAENLPLAAELAVAH